MPLRSEAVCSAPVVASRFVGPRADTIDQFGDKTKAKAVAAAASVPILNSSPGLLKAADAQAWLEQNPMPFPLLLKAASGRLGALLSPFGFARVILDEFPKWTAR